MAHMRFHMEIESIQKHLKLVISSHIQKCENLVNKTGLYKTMIKTTYVDLYPISCRTDVDIIQEIVTLISRGP